MKQLLVIVLCCLSHFAFAQVGTDIIGLWKVTTMGIDANADGAVETNIWKDCNAGTTMDFKVGGTGSYYKGENPCNTKGGNPQSFMWEVNAEGNILIKAMGKPDVLVFKKKSATTATLYFTDAKFLYGLTK